MKITIKTLKGQLFVIEAELKQTIHDVKSKIKLTKNFQIESQKLVFKGKNTVNTDTIESLGIKEGDFMVVMVTLKKPEQIKPVVEQPKVQQKPKQVPKPNLEHTKPIINNLVQPPQNKPPILTQNNLVVGRQLQATILQLMNMGFQRQQVEKALAAAFNNPQRAVQYLLNGIPKNYQQNIPNQQNQQIPVGLDPASLANIINSPQFIQIKQLIRNDPNALGGFLQQLQNSSPQLAQLIHQNPQLFERLIMEDSPLEGGQMPQQVTQPSIMVTNEQKAAIDRLAALGFSKLEAAQVYMACDKNQQLAANILFDRLQNGDIQLEQSYGQEEGEQEEQEGDDKQDDDNLFN